MLILACVTLSSVPSIRPVHSTTVEVNFQAWIAKDAASGLRLIVVDQSGAGDFETINEALDAVPLHNKDPITIKVNPGIYVYASSASSDQPNSCIISTILLKHRLSMH